jgi:hypothetical protein
MAPTNKHKWGLQRAIKAGQNSDSFVILFGKEV